MASAPGSWIGGAGSISVGAPADLVLVDLSEEWTVRADALVSRSGNSPYLGSSLRGRIVGTVVGGELIHDGMGARLGARV
jgi:dihydroorotase